MDEGSITPGQGLRRFFARELRDGEPGEKRAASSAERSKAQHRETEVAVR
jgi:hypothetical protein